MNNPIFLYTLLKKLSTKNLLITLYYIINQYIESKPLILSKRISLSEIEQYKGCEQ